MIKKTNWALVWKSLPQKEKRLVYILGGLVLFSTAAIGVNAYYANTVTAPANGGNYTEAAIGIPRFINPALAQFSDADRDITRLIYSGLMKYDKTGRLVEDLAASYVIENSTNYIFTLRENLLWHDGEPLTASDVAFTVKLIQDPKYASPIRLNWQGVEVEKIDERTISFQLATPYGPFLENATVGILPKHLWENVSPKSFALAEANLQPIGSGPYKFEKFQKDSSGNIKLYTLKANNRYYATPAHIERLVFKFFDSEEEAISAFQSREVNGANFVSGNNSSQLERTTGTRLYSFTLPRYFAVFLNQPRSKVLAEKSVRQAFALATDRSAIIDLAASGQGKPAYGPIIPELLGYNPQIENKYQFSLQEARSVLAKANWLDTDGDGVREKKLSGGDETVPLEISIITVQWPELEIVMRALREQWEKVGARVEINTFTLGELQQEFIRPREYEALLFGQVVGIDPDPFSFWHSSQKKDPGLNLSLYENSTVDKLLEEARQTLDAQARSEKYVLLQNTLSEDIPAIFLYTPSYLYPVNKKIKGIGEGKIADPSWRFADVNEWYIETKRVWN